MHRIFIVIFIINIISCISMGYVIIKLYTKNNAFADKNINRDELKNVTKLSVFIGLSGGIILWGCIIGVIVSLFTGDFSHLAQSFYLV